MKKNTPESMPFLQQYNCMKAQAQTWQSTWKELAAFIAPTRGFFEGETAGNGKKINHRVLIDSDPLLAVRFRYIPCSILCNCNYTCSWLYGFNGSVQLHRRVLQHSIWC